MKFSLELFSDWFKRHESEIVGDFFRFLRFKSISTDSSCRAECLQAADWLTGYLKSLDFSAQLLNNPGLPVVWAERKAQGSAKSVVLYHHYDVQPVDPVDLWQSDPFAPKMEDGKIFARGASDNKGQCFITLTALKAFSELGVSLPLEVKLFIEGEEESGSKGTRVVVEREKDRLKADYLCVIDFDLPSMGVPGIALGYRGLVCLEVECTNAATDLHSGVHGGIALNPIRILTNLLSKMWDEKGLVAVPGFYEGVPSTTPQEKELLDLHFDEEEYRREFGVGALSMEEGVSPKEASWLRPTLEINGIWGGYIQEGFKTVIPAKAHAKISCRLVGDQDPSKIAKCLEDFLLKHAPKGVQLRFRHHQGARALRTPRSPLISKVVGGLENVFEKPCSYTLCGGSIPIIGELAQAVGGDAAFFGFALETDNIHAPNEHFQWECFKKGFLSMAQILWNLSQ